MKYLNDGLDKTRIIENRELVSNCDEILKRSKFLFLENEANLTDKQAVRFPANKKSNLKTCQAWHIKENFKGFCNCVFTNEAKSYFSQWYLSHRLSVYISLSIMIKFLSLCAEFLTIFDLSQIKQ